MLIKQNRKRTQISKIRNERGEITINTTEIERIIRAYYEKLCARVPGFGFHSDHDLGVVGLSPALGFTFKVESACVSPCVPSPPLSERERDGVSTSGG